MKPKIIKGIYTGKPEDKIGPAIIIGERGGIAWLFDGKWHREDGPAVIWFDGTNFWHLHGRLFSQRDWFKTILKVRLK